MRRLACIVALAQPACMAGHATRPPPAPVAKSGPGVGSSGEKFEINPFDSVEPWQVWTAMGGMALLIGGVIWWAVSDDAPEPPPPPPGFSPRRPAYDDMDLDEIFDREPAGLSAEK